MISDSFFTFMIFIGVIIPIVSMALLMVLNLFEEEMDVLEVENARVKLEKELQLSEYAQLNQQIQPHFLFNTLNSFISLGRLGRSKEIVAAMERFSLFLRYRYKNKQTLVPFRLELEYTKHYLYIQQLRFGKKLFVYFHIDEDAIETTIPPYTLQTLTENAFKHGLEKREGEKVLEIELTREGNWVLLKVKDNGAESIPSNYEKRGIGLINLKKRLELLFDLYTYVDIKKDTDDHTVAAVLFPYTPEEVLENEHSISG
ncbi:sensor histidine kinase [Bacillus salitolerans]|uniref:Sensor histidine kinase n=1 Tax=Bacillus salitolerans TaxID=1437434 RepID=A0ABW4LWB5_9BACI